MPAMPWAAARATCNDQTLNLANQGYTPGEIAETIQLPAVRRNTWSSRGYYGSLSHSVKAIYDLYLGWFDGNPANLNPLPPVESSKKYVEMMRGSTCLNSLACWRALTRTSIS